MSTPVPAAIEDGSQITHQAWDLLVEEAKEAGLPELRVQPLGDFLHSAAAQQTTRADRETILDQATLIFDHLYPHMPFKAEIYQNTHPSDFIRDQIRPALDSLSELDFQERMISAFSLVRDAHTLYGLPSPFRRAVAFLPFQIRPYVDPVRGLRFIVTSVMNAEPGSGLLHPFFGAGAEITGWGDLTCLAHVERTQADLPGGNYFASLIRGSVHATLRPLSFVKLPFPDESPVATIHYVPRGGGEIRTLRFPWGVGVGFLQGSGFPSSAFSVSQATAITYACGKYLLHRPEMRDDRKAAAAKDPVATSSIPDVFDFQFTDGPRTKGFIDLADLTDRKNPDARFGYIKIKAFSDGSSGVGATDRMVEEFRRILTMMDEVAPDGLVIDLRSNPGGDVQAAERMLQMLIPQRVEPARFHLANTPAMIGVLRNLRTAMTGSADAADRVKLAAAVAELEAWLNDADQPPLPAGAPLTSGKPLTDPDSANDIGQVYHGRGVALLINSLTYSAADVFTAGFQDHSGGVVLGTSLITGGGGANVWSHDDLMQKIGPHPGIPLAALPGDASMSVAIRRCTRVGPFEGEPVEDQGVKVDVFYESESVDDLIAGNPALVRRACQELSSRPAFRVDAKPPALGADGSVSVEVKASNIESLKFFVNERFAMTVRPETDTAQSFTIPAPANGSSASVLRIEGYATPGDGGLQLVRARTIRLARPTATPGDDPVTKSITDTDAAAAS